MAEQRLIDANALVFDYSGLAYIYPDDFRGIAMYFAEQVKAMPTIEKRKTGKWIDEWRSRLDGTRYWYRACSECGFERNDDNPEKDTNFCPNCGAGMEEQHG